MSTLDNALGLTPYKPEKQSPTLVQTENVDTVDFDHARSTLYDVLEETKSAVDEMIGIASQSQHPKSYEVLNGILKTMADVSMNLVDLDIKRRKVLGATEAAAAPVTNNLFVGSTAELQMMIAQMQASKDEQ